MACQIALLTSAPSVTRFLILSLTQFLLMDAHLYPVTALFRSVREEKKLLMPPILPKQINKNECTRLKNMQHTWHIYREKISFLFSTTFPSMSFSKESYQIP
jgi:hypothetical protein